MKIFWKYDILFYFKIHYYIKDSNSDNFVIKELQSGDFIIIPSNSCRQLLKKYNLIFKTGDNVAYIIAEKKVISNKIYQTLWRINKQVAFTFILQLRNQSLFSGLLPYYTLPESKLQTFYGKRLLLYFDNLDKNLEPDKGLEPLPNENRKNTELNYLNISKNDFVNEDDLASLVPNKFSYNKTNEISEISLQPICPPPNDKLEFQLNEQKPAVHLKLAIGAYEFRQKGNEISDEIIFADSELYSELTFGVIQIYKNKTTDYNNTIRYDIHFKKLNTNNYGIKSK